MEDVWTPCPCNPACDCLWLSVHIIRKTREKWQFVRRSRESGTLIPSYPMCVSWLQQKDKLARREHESDLLASVLSISFFLLPQRYFVPSWNRTSKKKHDENCLSLIESVQQWISNEEGSDRPSELRNDSI